MSTQRRWNLNTKEIKRMYPKKADAKNKVHQLCNGEADVMTVLTTNHDYIDYIFRHPSNYNYAPIGPITGPSGQSTTANMTTKDINIDEEEEEEALENDTTEAVTTAVNIDDNEPEEALLNDTTEAVTTAVNIDANNEKEEENEMLVYDIASKPTENSDITAVLKKINDIYGHEILSLDQIDKIAEAGYSTGLLFDTLKASVVGQQGFLVSIGEDPATSMVIVHKILYYFKKHHKENPTSDLPIDEILELFSNVFNEIMGGIKLPEAGDSVIGHLQVYQIVKRFWQRKDYILVRNIQGKEALTIGKVRDEAVDVLHREGFVVKTLVKKEPKEKQEEEKCIVEEPTDKSEDKKKK
eukprot:28976_1